ncbi:hypothetical protein KGY79_08525, partial [Candidatus Bipolaricaulota bacterium]|nr:hypothetical protein [Candidatus Bipolaricaulota bacterium]
LERVNQNGLEGAMVWELTDHPERLSSLDVPWGQAYDNPEFRESTLHHGIFEVDYSKKPAAHVVEQYYKRIL